MIERAAFLKALLVATGGLDIWDPPDSPLPPVAPTAPPVGASPSRIIRVQLADGSIDTLDIEQYLYGVVPLESPPSWPAAALQAQAIVARTYALQKLTLSRPYDVVASDADQRYGGVAAQHPATNAAVDATRGQTVVYLGGLASVFYSSCCGGHSADADVLWGHAGLPYLRGVDDPYCTASPDYRWQRTLGFDRVQVALAGRLPAGPVAAELDAPDDSGRPQTVTFRGADGSVLALSVSEVRSRFGADTVRSLWLREIGFDRTQAVPLVVIEGSGRGHGVGLCQWGARGMALNGASASAILAHFFPGTTVTGG
ncbi:MAG: SpoIID/LytB domain-containing protein [Candidatus Lustribacter sp.]